MPIFSSHRDTSRRKWNRMKRALARTGCEAARPAAYAHHDGNQMTAELPLWAGPVRPPAAFASHFTAVYRER